MFIQIVRPINIRPREGDSFTGYMKLKKTLSTIKVGKQLIKKIREQINEV